MKSEYTFKESTLREYSPLKRGEAVFPPLKVYGGILEKTI